MINLEEASEAIDRIIEIEGGYVNHPKDKGGPTNMGITLKTLCKWRKSPVTKRDVRNLTVDEAVSIYYYLYFKPLGLHRLSSYPGLSLCLLDQGVNRGVITVARQIQRIVGTNADGVIGSITIAAIKKYTDAKLTEEFIDRSIVSYSRIVQRDPEQSIFLTGWMRRIHRLCIDTNFVLYGSP